MLYNFLICRITHIICIHIRRYLRYFEVCAGKEKKTHELTPGLLKSELLIQKFYPQKKSEKTCEMTMGLN